MNDEPKQAFPGPLSLQNLTQLVYLLQALGFFVGITWLIAVVVNYVKLDEVRGTWMESHFRWQIRTFWFGLLWGVLGAITVIVFVGIAILVADAVWLIYRIVKGWLDFNARKPMYAVPGASLQ
jgi:uncharacterized membrane protein